MTTKFLTIKFAKFPNFIVMEFLKKNSVFGQLSLNFAPPQNANFINIVVSASLKVLDFPGEVVNLRKSAVFCENLRFGLSLSLSLSLSP